MRMQTKALIASAVVLVLALSAVSGITYSWFSDVEKSDITVDTAEVDYGVAFSGIANGVAKLEQNGSTFTLTGIAAGATIQIKADITNSSTVKTVYKVVLVPTYANPGEGATGLTPYDMKNIRVTTADNTTKDLASQKKESWTLNDDGILTTATFNQIIIQDWKEVDTPASDGQSVGSVTAVITTPDTYGGSNPRQPVVAIDADGNGYTAKPDTGTYYDWNAQTVRSGLSFELRVIAVQGDYPYTTMDVADGVASATIPTNKIVTAASVSTAGGTTGSGTVTNVIVDFSNVDKYEVTPEEEGGETTTEDLVSQNIKLKVDKIESSQIELDLSLYTVTTGESITETLVKNPTFDNPVVITMTVPGEITNPKVVYNSEDGTDGTDGTVLSSTINSDGTTTVVFSVDHFSNYIIKHDKGIETEQELRNALLKGGYIKLADSLTVTKTLECAVDGTVLDLNGKSITTGKKSLIEVDADLEIRNGTLECTYGQNTEESEGRVINIDHEDKGITGVTLKLRNVDVVGPTSNDYNRGVSVWGTTDLTIDIDGGKISANHYPVNIAPGNTGIQCMVKNATLTGYCAVQTWSEDSVLKFMNCTMNGVNTWGGDSDDYGTIVVVDSATGSEITCEGCTISAVKNGTSEEYLIDIRAACKIVLNDCTYAYNGQTLGVADVKAHSYIEDTTVSRADFDDNGADLEIESNQIINVKIDKNYLSGDKKSYMVGGTVWDTDVSNDRIDVYIEFDAETTCNGQSVDGSTILVGPYGTVSSAQWPEGTAIASIIFQMPNVVSSSTNKIDFSSAPMIVAVIHDVDSNPGEVAVQHQGDQPGITTVWTEYDSNAKTLTVVFTPEWMMSNVEFNFVTAVGKITSGEGDVIASFGNTESLKYALSEAGSKFYNVSVGDTVEILKDFTTYSGKSYEVGTYTIADDWTLTPVTDSFEE